MAGLAVSGGGCRSLFSKGRGLVNEADPCQRAGPGCLDDGALASSPDEDGDGAFGSGVAVRQRRLATLLSDQQAAAQHESTRQLLG